MWLSIVVLGMIFIMIGFFANEILRTVLKELAAIRKELNHEK